MKFCRVQFPIYLRWWSKKKDEKGRVSLLQEQVFNVPYELPSGRVVYLRGKWDGIDLIKGNVWLLEHKTKGDIDEHILNRNLSFDLQTMLYLVALHSEYGYGYAQRGHCRCSLQRHSPSIGRGQRNYPTEEG